MVVKKSPAKAAKEKRDKRIADIFNQMRDAYVDNATQLYHEIEKKTGVSYATVIRVLQRQELI